MKKKLRAFYSVIPLIAMLVISSSAMSLLFQVFFYEERGDHTAHLNTARVLFTANENNLRWPKQSIKYPLYHVLVKAITYIFGGGQYEAAAIFVMVVSNIFSVLIMRYIMLEELNLKRNFYKKYIIDICCVAYIFFAPMAGWLTDGRIYEMNCGPNPWQNPTIIMVRPIGLLALYFFCKMMKRIELQEKSINYMLGFGVTLFLTLLAKPNFVYVFLPAMGLVVLKYWSRDWKNNFKNSMIILAVVIPTLILGIYQCTSFVEIYTSRKAEGIHFALGGFSKFNFVDMIKVSIATFPVPILTILLCDKKQLMEDIYIRVSYFALLFGWLQMFFLTNGRTGDFSWGYDLAVGIATLISLKKLIEKGFKKRYFVIYGAYLYQTLVGVYYFIEIYKRDGVFWF